MEYIYIFYNIYYYYHLIFNEIIIINIYYKKYFNIDHF